MQTTLNIFGMHCQACETLIRMELEENNLAENIISLKADPTQNQGALIVATDNQAEIEKIKQIINTVPGYKIN